MKPGDTVLHKNRETYKLIRINGPIAVCRRVVPERSKFGHEVWTALCRVENLTATKQSAQLQLP